MNKIWWLWVPVCFMAVQAVLEILLPHHVLSALHSENGPHELLQFIAVSAACGVAAAIFLRLDKKRDKWLAAWAALAALCCLYVAGEEISWGQQFLNWGTPEFWAGINDQQETNLHNTSSWLDQKPRLALLVGVITGGLIIPLLQKYRPAWVPQKFAVIYPPPQLAVIALLALAVKVADKAGEGMGLSLFERVSEVEELYLFYFVLLYMIALKKRVLR